MVGKIYRNAASFDKALSKTTDFTPANRKFILQSAEIHKIKITLRGLEVIDSVRITEQQKRVLQKLEGQIFIHKWLLENALAEKSPSWQLKNNNAKNNADLRRRLTYLFKIFHYENK